MSDFPPMRVHICRSEASSGSGEIALEKFEESHRMILNVLRGGGLDLADVWKQLKDTRPKLPIVASRGDLVRTLLEMEGHGLITIQFQTSNQALTAIYEGGQKAQQACMRDPGLWNVLAYESEWSRYGEYFDFLDPDAPNHALKDFQFRIYMNQVNEYIAQGVPKGGRILDAGGGVGRFSVGLLRSNYEVVLLDASPRALKCCLRHFEEEGLQNYSLLLGDARDLSFFPDNVFDAVFAMELICYCTQPEQALQELRRVCAPGGWMFLSVEGKYGSLLTDSKIAPAHFRTVYERDLLLRENDVFVRYYTLESFRELLVSHQLEVVDLRGSHYVPDGIFHRYVQDDGCLSREAERLLWEIEETCAADAYLQPLARAWTAVCRKA